MVKRYIALFLVFALMAGQTAYAENQRGGAQGLSGGGNGRFHDAFSYSSGGGFGRFSNGASRGGGGDGFLDWLQGMGQTLADLTDSALNALLRQFEQEEYAADVAAMQESLGTTTVVNDGRLIFKVPFTEANSMYKSYGGIMYHSVFPDWFGKPLAGDHKWTQVNIHTYDDRYTIAYSGNTRYGPVEPVRYYYKLAAPINGAYRLHNTYSEVTDFRYMDNGGKTHVEELYFVPEYLRTDQTKYYGTGENISVYYSHWTTNDDDILENITIPRWIEIECIPLENTIMTQTTNYINNTDSRVGSVVTNYSYGDTVYDNTSIVNENTNTVYNPVTGETHNISDWYYDYADRSYTITTDNSQQITITYGDEHLTIQEGGTVYNINYYIYGSDDDDGGNGGGTDGGNGGNGGTSPAPDSSPSPSPALSPSPSPNPGASPSPNINPGTVTSVDDDDSGGGFFSWLGDKLGGLASGVLDLFLGVLKGILGALIDFVIDMFGKVTEGLTAFVTMITQFFLEIPLLFAGFVGFLSAVFPFLPGEFTTVITFGMILTVVAAVVKKLLG